MKKQIRPSGAKDSNSDERAMTDNNHRLLKNMRFSSSDEATLGAAVSIRSTLERTVFEDKPNSILIGSAVYHETDSIIRIIYQPIPELVHFVQFFTDENSPERLIMTTTNSLFGFNETEKITHALVVGEMLIFSYPGTGIKKFNINKAVEFTISGGTSPNGYPFIDVQTVDAAPYPPKFRPNCEYGYDDNFISNFISEGLFQFTYRYIYDDKEVSTLGHYSELMVPFESWSDRGRRDQSDIFPNHIKLTVKTGHHKVDKIQVCVRDGNLGPWYIFETIDKKILDIGDNIDYELSFYNNEARQILPDDDYENYTSMPIECFCVQYTSENFLTIGNYKSGYEKPEIDVVLSARKEPIIDASNDIEWRMVKRNYNSGNASNPTDYYYMGVVIVKSIPPEGTIIGATLIMNCMGNLTYDFGETTFFAQKTSDATYTLKRNVRFNSPSYDFNYRVTAADEAGTINQFVANLQEALGKATLALRNNSQTGQGYGAPTILTYADLTAAWWPNEDISPDVIPGSTLCIRMTNQNFPQLGVGEGGIPNYIFDEITVGFEMFSATLVETDIPSDSFTPFSFRGFLPAHYYRKKGNNLLEEAKTIKDFKSGSWAVFGLNYYDDVKRDSTVVKTESTSVYIPFTNETTETYTEFFSATRNTIQWAINHVPPIWAKSYSWVYKGRAGVGRFQQRFARIIARSEPHLGLVIEGGSLYNRENAGTETEIAVGDVVRFIGSYSNTGNNFDPLYASNIPTPTSYKESVVVAVSTESPQSVPLLENEITVWIAEFDMESIGLQNSNTNSGVLVEIYTPENIDDEGIFNEFAEDYPILNPGQPNRSHGGQTQDQTDILPATGVFIHGDIYRRIKTMSFIKPIDTTPLQQIGVFVEAESFSEFLENSDSWNKGRVAVFNETNRVIENPQAYNYSGKYFENTEVNELFRISAVNQQSLPVEDGALYKMFFRGYTLKLYQERKINSVYINRQEIYAADGTSQTILIDRVLGTRRPSVRDFGSSHPESFVSDGSYVYFWDQLNRTIVRDDLNGPDAIAMGMQNDFDELAAILAAKKGFIVSGYDRRNKEIIFAFEPYDSLSGIEEYTFCISFDLARQHWAYDYDFNPSAFVELNNKLFSLKKDRVWEHDAGVGYANIYGVQRTIEWWPVFNDQPALSKFLNSIVVDSNVAPEIYEILIDSKQGHNKRAMKSMIPAAAFDEEQGPFYATFNKNMLTPRLTEAQGLIYGEDLQGETALLKIRFETQERAVIFGIIIDHTPSMLTP